MIALGSSVEIDTAEITKALRGKKVVTIAAHDGPLAAVARVALPACVWAETDGTYVNKQGKAQQSERALRPRGDAVPGWLLVAKLARQLGFAMNWRKLSEIRKAMAGDSIETSCSHAPPALPAEGTETEARS